MTAEALEPLRAAKALTPTDPLTLYLLARAEDVSGDREAAIGTYGQILTLAPNSRTPVVRRRLEELSLARIQEALKGVREREDQLPRAAAALNTIIVPDLDAPASNDTLRVLSRGLAVVLITDLSQVSTLQVLERQRLQVLQAEMRIPLHLYGPDPHPDLALPVDEGDATRFGTLLGARRIAQGGLAPLADEGLRMNMVVFDASRGGVEATCKPVPGRILEVMSMEKELFVDMLTRLGLPVSAELKRQMRKPVTTNFDAFYAFSRGVEAEDLGRPDDAARDYALAARLDPAFRLARERQEVLSAGPGAIGQSDQMAWAEASTTESHEDRSDRSMDELGVVPRTSSVNPTLSISSKLGAQRLVIRGRLP
jgi:tetratricopeptide (TPR) repeat protein